MKSINQYLLRDSPVNIESFTLSDMYGNIIKATSDASLAKRHYCGDIVGNSEVIRIVRNPAFREAANG